MERREAELLNRLDQILCFKTARLLSQMDRLKIAETKLNYVNELLRDTTLDSNGSPPSKIDLFLINEKAAHELRLLRAFKSELAPCEDDNVYFVPVIGFLTYFF